MKRAECGVGWERKEWRYLLFDGFELTSSVFVDER